MRIGDGEHTYEWNETWATMIRQLENRSRDSVTTFPNDLE